MRSNLRRASRTGWCTLLLTAAMLQAVQAETVSVTRTSSYAYDAKGTLIRETVEPDDVSGAYRVVTDLVPNAFGLTETRTTQWQDPFEGAKSRIERTGYDPRGRFQTSDTNAKQQTETRVFDEGTGQVRQQTDPNQLVTTWDYDAFGRKRRESRPDGTATSWEYRRCIDSCLNNASQVTVTQHWAGSSQIDVPTEEFTDLLGHAVLTRTWGFDGTPVLVEKLFDDKGRLSHVSRPRFSTGSAVWTEYIRDDLGRVMQVASRKKDGTCCDYTTYAYHGLTRSGTNANNQTRTEIRDGLGMLRTVTDALQYSTKYVYEPFGNLTRVTDARANTVAIAYDRVGRKLALDDPDLGQWRYTVDALGQTLRQTDAKGQEVQFSYDELGRLIRRLEPDLDGRWEYDTAVKGVGKLAEAYTLAAGAKDYRRLHSYDSAGRPSSVTTRLDWDYVTMTNYDAFGRVGQVDYQRNLVDGSGGPKVSFVHRYNAQGQLFQIDNVVGGTTSMVWQQQEEDAEGRIKREQLGNGLVTQRGYNPHTGRLESITSGPNGSASHQSDSYQYDPLGNLTRRVQLGSAGSMTEDLTYDPLNRLKTSTIGAAQKSIDYDEIGNIRFKSDVGLYGYGASGPGSIGPRAVSGITGTVAGLASPQLAYDDNGNLLNGLGRGYAWTSYNMPSSIDKYTGDTAVQRTSFAHGADHERFRQTISPMSSGVPGSPSVTVWYGGAIEKEIDLAANTTTVRTYMSTALGFIEEKFSGTSVAPTAAPTSVGTRYFLNDHLGSPIAVVDQNQVLLQRMSYDPWGRRRNTDGSDDTGPQWGSLKNDQDHRGYTGHESLDQLGLVHMNARLYDPLLGRHTSADPTVPDPADPQAFNRYSYVLNNALAYVDPTGLAGRIVEGPEPKKPDFRSICSGEPGCAAYINPDVESERASKTAAKGAGEIAGQGLRVAKNFLDGGFGDRAAAAYGSGDYGWAATYTLAGTAYGVANGLTLGEAGGISKLLTTSLTKLESMVASSALGARGAAETTTLYRAVTQAELKQIQKTGAFEAGSNSLGGKWFAETADHARQWGNAMNGKGASTILEVQLPRSQANKLMRMERLDGIGPARYGELEQLRGAIIKALGL